MKNSKDMLLSLVGLLVAFFLLWTLFAVEPACANSEQAASNIQVSSEAFWQSLPG